MGRLRSAGRKALIHGHNRRCGLFLRVLPRDCRHPRQASRAWWHQPGILLLIRPWRRGPRPRRVSRICPETADRKRSSAAIERCPASAEADRKSARCFAGPQMPARRRGRRHVSGQHGPQGGPPARERQSRGRGRPPRRQRSPVETHWQRPCRGDGPRRWPAVRHGNAGVGPRHRAVRRSRRVVSRRCVPLQFDRVAGGPTPAARPACPPSAYMGPHLGGPPPVGWPAARHARAATRVAS